MSTPGQSTVSAATPPEDGAFPFPSIVGEFELTIPPAEVAMRLAVPVTHVQALIAGRHLDTLREPNTRQDWITAASLKTFLLSRLSKPISESFSRPQYYLKLREFHQEIALRHGEEWDYLEASAYPDSLPFVPKRLQVPAGAALTPDQIQSILGWSPELLAAIHHGHHLAGIIAIQASETGELLLRVPLESYYLWLRMLLSCGPNIAGGLLSQDIREAIYDELGQFLHACRREPKNEDQN